MLEPNLQTLKLDGVIRATSESGVVEGIESRTVCVQHGIPPVLDGTASGVSANGEEARVDICEKRGVSNVRRASVAPHVQTISPAPLACRMPTGETLERVEKRSARARFCASESIRAFVRSWTGIEREGVSS
jgi:hypothetical protein